MSDQTAMDKALLAYRADPSEANRLRLEALQQTFVTATYRRNADEYIRRTR